MYPVLKCAGFLFYLFTNRPNNGKIRSAFIVLYSSDRILRTREWLSLHFHRWDLMARREMRGPPMARDVKPRDLQEPMSRKAIVIMIGWLALFCLLGFLTLKRISNPEMIFVFLLEMFIVSYCFYYIGSEWFPRNFKTRYLWYWLERPQNEDRRLRCQTGFNPSRAPVAFRLKISGWSGNNQIFVDGKPSDDWRVEVFKDLDFFSYHDLIIYDKEGRPLYIEGHGFHSVEYLLWVVESAPDLSKHWNYEYTIAKEHRDMINALLVLEEASAPDGTMGNKWQAKFIRDFVGAELDQVIGRWLNGESTDDLLPGTDLKLSCKRYDLENVLRNCTGRMRLLPAEPVFRCSEKKMITTS
jgi:hypothetical protein